METKLSELAEKHREVKQMILVLLERMDNPNWSKAKLKDELFKIFMEIK